MTVIQASTGCICQTVGQQMEIYSFEGFHELIMDTLRTETNAEIIGYTTDMAEIAA